MLGAAPLAHRPLVAAPLLPRPFSVAASDAEYGWAAWSFSRQAKLNAWSWHGLGASNLHAWAVLGNCMYVRKESDSFVHVMLPDVFIGSDATSTDSDSVEATTQWLDFGKVGKLKALEGIDADCQNVTAIEVYISTDGGRTGELAASLPIGDNRGGWTYNGEVIPISLAATEFKLRFVCDPLAEAQVNRVSLHWTPLEG